MYDYKFNIGDIVECTDRDDEMCHLAKDMVPRFTVTIYADEDNNIRIVESGESGVTAAASAPTFENAVYKAMNEFLSKKKHKRGIESVDENDIEMDMLYWCVKSDKDKGYIPVPMIWDGNNEDKTNRDARNMYHSKAAAEEKIRQLKLIV